MITANMMRILLLVISLVMLLLSLFYLTRRKLPLLGYCTWGLFALILPFLGPLLVIACRPGESNSNS